MLNFSKKMTIVLVIAKFKYLTFDPLLGVKGGTLRSKGIEQNLDTAMFIYRHWAIMLNIIALMECEDYYTKRLI